MLPCWGLGRAQSRQKQSLNKQNDFPTVQVKPEVVMAVPQALFGGEGAGCRQTERNKRKKSKEAVKRKKTQSYRCVDIEKEQGGHVWSGT